MGQESRSSLPRTEAPTSLPVDLKRKGKSITQNFEELKLYEDEKLVASMKTEAIAEQFKAITGLDKELYREIVWFRQEHLKELLDAAPRDRQRRLDELFGLIRL